MHQCEKNNNNNSRDEDENVSSHPLLKERIYYTQSFTMKMPTYDQNPGKKAYSGFGNLMLEKMGWKHGDALGANPSKGLKEAISVDMKNDREGVGKEKKERYNWEEKWWEGHFKSAAEKFALAVVEGGGKGGGKDDDDERKGKGNTSNSSSSSSSESEDEFERNVREITSGNNVMTTKEELKEKATYQEFLVKKRRKEQHTGRIVYNAE